jgi:recombination associated protein RdgC
MESAKAEIDARFALMSLELRRLFDKIDEWFGMPRPGDRE